MDWMDAVDDVGGVDQVEGWIRKTPETGSFIVLNTVR